jgi:hypothetical protein
MPNYDECTHAGIDPQIVARFERRISRLLKDMDMHGLSIFCGSSSGTIRYNDGQERPLIVGEFSGHNHDGGDGAVFPDAKGLERGE